MDRPRIKKLSLEYYQRKSNGENQERGKICRVAKYAVQLYLRFVVKPGIPRKCDSDNRKNSEKQFPVSPFSEGR